MNENNAHRTAEAPIDNMFLDRWSPRAFVAEELSGDQIKSLFEAARWAPSCFNEQPTRFYFAATPEDRARFLPALVERNQLWACKAPLLVFVVARKCFTEGGKENRWASFDAGAAWMSLALQARKLGLYAHCMAGFSAKKAYELLGLDEEQDLVLAAVAIGRKGDAADLPDELREMEAPNDRRPLSEVMIGTA